MKWILLTLIIGMVSCEFSKSAGKDFITGLTTKGDGLSCQQVFLSDGDEKINRNTFTYGEKFFVHFDDITGFTEIEEFVFPGMQMIVTDAAGEIVMNREDLYASASSEGFSISPLMLQASLTVAAPIHSNQNYTLQLNIWDKKGKGTFTAKLDFSVAPNNKIAIESHGVSYDEIYLFSQNTNLTIIDNKASINETVYIIFEGLDGFVAEDGKVYAGLSIKATDAGGEILIDEADLLGDSGMALADLKSQLAPNVVFSDPSIKTPVACEVQLWDKKSENRITASLNLEIN